MDYIPPLQGDLAPDQLIVNYDTGIAVLIPQPENTPGTIDTGVQPGNSRVRDDHVVPLGSPGDVLLALSTSGSSENVVQAARTARERGIVVCAITGASGHRLADEAEHALLLPSTLTADVQVATLTCLHAIANLLEERVGRVP